MWPAAPSGLSYIRLQPEVSVVVPLTCQHPQQPWHPGPLVSVTNEEPGTGRALFSQQQPTVPPLVNFLLFRCVWSDNRHQQVDWNHKQAAFEGLIRGRVRSASTDGRTEENARREGGSSMKKRCGRMAGDRGQRRDCAHTLGAGKKRREWVRGKKKRVMWQKSRA